MTPSAPLVVIALVCLGSACAVDQPASVPAGAADQGPAQPATHAPGAHGDEGAAPARTTAFSTTVTPDQSPAIDAGGGSGTQGAAMCWSSGPDSWSKQGQRQALAAQGTATDPILESRKAEFIALVARWREAVAAKRYGAAETTFTQALAMLDDLALRRVPVAEQIAFTKREYAQCLVSDVVTRLAGDWPAAGDDGLALARSAVAAQPEDPSAMQVMDAATAASWESRGRLQQRQATTIGQRIDQLTAQALADRARAIRLAASGEADGARTRALHATACLDDCYHELQRLIPLESEARTAFQSAHAAALRLLTRAHDAELAGHPLLAVGVRESTALAASQALLLGAADGALAREYLLVGKPAQGLPLAREALQLVPDSTAYQDLCQRLQPQAGSARPQP
jgi:hypothetical protein